jgi:hypothetical protein
MGRDEIGGVSSVSAHSAGAYTATVYVLVTKVKGGGRAPSPAWSNFSIMMECMPESGRCHSVCTLWFRFFWIFSTYAQYRKYNDTHRL